jgi:hypothetical protein
MGIMGVGRVIEKVRGILCIFRGGVSVSLAGKRSFGVAVRCVVG